ncbi:MAG: hypothetical protein FJ271_25710 [Planctomycetes bacterium]|nr:hypothetical protein [Planctomycetota bacterium]
MTACKDYRTIPEAELLAAPPVALDWLWHGFVASGNVSLLTSMWKSGKTTLLSLLLARRRTGDALAGLDVKPGKTLVVTEEPAELWAERARRLDFGGLTFFISRPFRGIPTEDQWRGLVQHILDERAQQAIDLAVFDPIAPLLRSENQPQALLATLAPLAALTASGMAVLLLHHPSKGKHQEGNAARGSGAMLGHVDIAIEMRHPGGDLLTRRRRFLAMSRHAATPRQLLRDWRDDGLDYLPVTRSEADDSFDTGWEGLRLVLEDAPQKLTLHDIRCEWPDDYDRPSRSTLYTWLQKALATGAIAVEGAGLKSDPRRYWLPARLEAWRQANPLYDIHEKDRLFWNRPFQPLHGDKVNDTLSFPLHPGQLKSREDEAPAEP